MTGDGLKVFYSILMGVLLTVSGGIVPVSAEPFGVKVQGTWTGTGMVREYPDQPEQTGRCKLAVTGEATGNVFTFKGKCATARRTGKMTFSFTQNPGTTAITAVGSSTVSAGKVTYNGQASEAGLEMLAGKAQRIGARDYVNTVRVSLLKNNQFRFEMDARDIITDRVRTIMNMVFERK